MPIVATLLAGALFSWPLFGPSAGAHLHPLAGVVYLFSACVGCSLLGLLITFAPADTYQHYARAAWCGTASLAPNFANNPWGLSLADDQQAAGLMKKVGGPFWPNAAWRDITCSAVVMLVIITLAAIHGPPELTPPPSPASIYTNPAPDWYLLPVFALFALMPARIESYVIFIGPVLSVLALLALSFVSNASERSPLRRPWAVFGAGCVVVSKRQSRHPSGRAGIDAPHESQRGDSHRYRPAAHRRACRTTKPVSNSAPLPAPSSKQT